MASGSAPCVDSDTDVRPSANALTVSIKLLDNSHSSSPTRGDTPRLT
jgi:hypothetical protein